MGFPWALLILNRTRSFKSQQFEKSDSTSCNVRCLVICAFGQMLCMVCVQSSSVKSSVINICPSPAALFPLLFLVYTAVSAADILLRGDSINITKLLGSAQLAASHSCCWHLPSLLRCFECIISAGLSRPHVCESDRSAAGSSGVLGGSWPGHSDRHGEGKPQVLWACQALQWLRETVK